MMKKCIKCDTYKELEFFTKKSGRVNQYMSYCKECFKIYRKAQYQVTKDHETEVRKEWYINNKDKKQKYEQEFRKEYYRKNIQFRIGLNLRIRLHTLLKVKDISKVGNAALVNLGCSINDLKQHLEAKFQSGMTWDNYSLHGWHIDHIRPMSSFDLSDPAQQKLACHYTNLQPLWAKDNLKKGSTYAAYQS